MVASLASRITVFSDVDIPASQLINNVAVPSGMSLKGVLVPAVWTSSTISLDASEDGALYHAIKNRSGGTDVFFNMTLTDTWQILTRREIFVSAGFPFLAFRLSSGQAAARTLRCMWLQPDSV